MIDRARLLSYVRGLPDELLDGMDRTAGPWGRGVFDPDPVRAELWRLVLEEVTARKKMGPS